jgi:hypothetical protein
MTKILCILFAVVLSNNSFSGELIGKIRKVNKKKTRASAKVKDQSSIEKNETLLIVISKDKSCSGTVRSIKKKKKKIVLDISDCEYRGEIKKGMKVEEDEFGEDISEEIPDNNIKSKKYLILSSISYGIAAFPDKDWEDTVDAIEDSLDEFDRYNFLVQLGYFYKLSRMPLYIGPSFNIASLNYYSEGSGSTTTGDVIITYKGEFILNALAMQVGGGALFYLTPQLYFKFDFGLEFIPYMTGEAKTTYLDGSKLNSTSSLEFDLGFGVIWGVGFHIPNTNITLSAAYMMTSLEQDKETDRKTKTTDTDGDTTTETSDDLTGDDVDLEFATSNLFVGLSFAF